MWFLILALPVLLTTECWSSPDTALRRLRLFLPSHGPVPWVLMDDLHTALQFSKDQIPYCLDWKQLEVGDFISTTPIRPSHGTSSGDGVESDVRVSFLSEFLFNSDHPSHVELAVVLMAILDQDTLFRHAEPLLTQLFSRVLYDPSAVAGPYVRIVKQFTREAGGPGLPDSIIGVFLRHIWHPVANGDPGLPLNPVWGCIVRGTSPVVLDELLRSPEPDARTWAVHYYEVICRRFSNPINWLQWYENTSPNPSYVAEVLALHVWRCVRHSYARLQSALVDRHLSLVVDHDLGSLSESDNNLLMVADSYLCDPSSAVPLTVERILSWLPTTAAVRVFVNCNVHAWKPHWPKMRDSVKALNVAELFYHIMGHPLFECDCISYEDRVRVVVQALAFWDYHQPSDNAVRKPKFPFWKSSYSENHLVMRLANVLLSSGLSRWTSAGRDRTVLQWIVTISPSLRLNYSHRRLLKKCVRRLETSTSSSLPAPTSSSIPAPTSSSIPAPTSSTLPAPTSSSIPAPTSSSIPAPTSSTLPAPSSSSIPAPTSSTLPAPTSSSVPASTSSQLPSGKRFWTRHFLSLGTLKQETYKDENCYMCACPLLPEDSEYHADGNQSEDRKFVPTGRDVHGKTYLLVSLGCQRPKGPHLLHEDCVKSLPPRFQQCQLCMSGGQDHASVSTSATATRP